MRKYTLNRKTYKDVKKMDHQQMDQFCQNLYKAGRTERKELIDKWIRVRYIWKCRSSLAKMFR